MIDQRGMPDRRLCCLKRTFFQDSGVKRTPARILAIRNQTVPEPERTSMCFANRKNRVRRTKCTHDFPTRTIRISWTNHTPASCGDQGGDRISDCGLRGCERPPAAFGGSPPLQGGESSLAVEKRRLDILERGSWGEIFEKALLPLLEGGANRFSFHTHDLAADNGEIRNVNTTCGLRKASEMSKGERDVPLAKGDGREAAGGMGLRPGLHS